MKKQDVLAAEPLLNVFFLLAVVVPFAHLELHGELLGCKRVVVTPYDEVIFIDALEFFLVEGDST